MSLWLALTLAPRAQEANPDPDFRGQPVDADLLQLSQDSERFLTVQDAQAIEGRGLQLRVMTQTARNPYVWIDPVTAEETAVLSRYGGAVLGGSFWRGPARIGLDVPVYWNSQGISSIETGPTVGDARLGGRWTLRPGGEESWGLAAIGSLGLPLGAPETLLSSAEAWGELGVVADYRVGRVLVAANAAALFVPRSEVSPDWAWDDGLRFGLGVGVAAHERLDVSAELSGRSAWNDFLGLGQATPISAMLGLNAHLLPWLDLRAGAGTGLTSSIGAPDLQALAGLAYRPPEVYSDQDGDGVWDRDDDCPSAVEDRDGFQDQDGCPDPDNDQDGVPDLSDRCPDELEDPDGWLDSDGCFDANATLRIVLVDWGGRPVDNASLVLSPSDEAGEAFDFTGQSSVEVTLPAGAWDLQVQAEGYLAYFEPIEVPDEGWQELGVKLKTLGEVADVNIWAKDAQGESVRGLSVEIDGDGHPVPVVGGGPHVELHPGPHELVVRGDRMFPLVLELDAVAGDTSSLELVLQPELVALSEDHLRLERAVEFQPGTAELQPASAVLLDQVAAVLARHPEIKTLRIEAHTDDKGPANANLALSQKRADAVRRELIQRGVRYDRVYAVGFGEDLPLDEADSAEAREKNRRVDFFIEAKR
jgi:OOP family OmpA-OmpF porin